MLVTVMDSNVANTCRQNHIHTYMQTHKNKHKHKPKRTQGLNNSDDIWNCIYERGHTLAKIVKQKKTEAKDVSMSAVTPKQKVYLRAPSSRLAWGAGHGASCLAKTVFCLGVSSILAAIKATGAVLEPVDAASCRRSETSSSMQWEPAIASRERCWVEFSPPPPHPKKKRTQD